MKIVVLEGHAVNPGDLSWDWLEHFGAVTVYPRLVSPQETIARIGDAEIILINKTPITEEILAACPNLKLMCVLATGYNVVDCAAAAKRNIPVCNVPAYGTAAVAQFTFALLLELCHAVGHHSDAVHAGKWCASTDFCFWDTPQMELAGKTMGIIGFGKIGRAVGSIAKVFGMNVLAYNRSRCPEGEAIGQYVDLDTHGMFICSVTEARVLSDRPTMTYTYYQENVKPKQSLLSSARTIFRNKSFVTFFAGDMFSYLSMAFFQTAMLYYITMLLNVPESQSFLVMLSAIGVALCLFPMIVRFSKQYGKKTMLVIASVIFTVVFGFIYFADKLAALAAGYELLLGLCMGVVVAFPFAAINILPQSCMSDIIQKDSIEHGVNREGFFSATKTFIEKIAYSMAMVVVSSVLAIGAPAGEAVGTLGVKLTGVFAGVFSLASLICFMAYDEKSVTAFIAKHRKEGAQR